MQFPVSFLDGRYVAHGVFADSGGMGLLLDAEDTVCSGNRVLLKTTRYDSGTNAKHFRYTQDEAVRFVEKTRAILEWEKKVLVRFRNEGLNNIPSANHFFQARSTTLKTSYDGKNGRFEMPQEILNVEPYLVMELINGEILETRMKRESFRDELEKNLLALSREILTVFIKLHRHVSIAGRDDGYFIYQDLKPANVIVSGHGYFTLIDFGAVTLKLGDKTTEPTAGCVTVGYAAPESENGNEAYIDQRFDIYTLGATLWHAVTLRDPRELAPGTRLDVSSFSKHGLSRRFTSIVHKSLTEDLSKRYQTAEEMRRDVMAALRETV